MKKIRGSTTLFSYISNHESIRANEEFSKNVCFAINSLDEALNALDLPIFFKERQFISITLVLSTFETLFLQCCYSACSSRIF